MDYERFINVLIYYNDGDVIMKHLIKIGILLLMAIFSIAGWIVLFYIISLTTISDDNSVIVRTNVFNEMWFEYYLSIFIICSTIIIVAMLIYTETKN